MPHGGQVGLADDLAAPAAIVDRHQDRLRVARTRGAVAGGFPTPPLYLAEAAHDQRVGLRQLVDDARPARLHVPEAPDHPGT